MELSPWERCPEDDSEAREVFNRISHRGLELSNGLELLNYSVGPMQTIFCPACMMEGCSRTDYVQAFSLDGRVLWVPPLLGTLDGLLTGQFAPTPSVVHFGGLLFTNRCWKFLAQHNDWLPAVEMFPMCRRSTVAGLWLFGAEQRYRNFTLLAAQQMIEHSLVGSDSFGAQEVLDRLMPLIEWLSNNPDAIALGDVVEAESIGATIENLYFDDCKGAGWPALGVWGSYSYLALNSQLMYMSRVSA